MDAFDRGRRLVASSCRKDGVLDMLSVSGFLWFVNQVTLFVEELDENHRSLGSDDRTFRCFIRYCIWFQYPSKDKDAKDISSVIIAFHAGLLQSAVESHRSYEPDNKYSARFRRDYKKFIFCDSLWKSTLYGWARNGDWRLAPWHMHDSLEPSSRWLCTFLILSVWKSPT